MEDKKCKTCRFYTEKAHKVLGNDGYCKYVMNKPHLTKESNSCRDWQETKKN